MQFIDLKTQSQRIEKKLLERFSKVLRHGAYILGPEVAELESALSDFTGVPYVLSVSSGTDALLIALMALDIGPGDEVVTTPFSFFATAEVIALVGATPVFVDICPETYNINPNLIEQVITPKTKAIMPVNLYGQCADYDQINALAKKYNLYVVEDAAQSFGATYKARLSGGLGTIGCTSFFPSKPLGGYGDGGACFTHDAELAQRIKSIRNHGQKERYCHTRLGINGRLDTFQAAVLLEKLNIFPEEFTMRQHVAKRYQSILEKMGVQSPIVLPHNQSSYAQFTIEVKDRHRVQELLNQKGIPTAVHYPLGLNKQPIIQDLYPQSLDFNNTEYAADHVLSLPMHPYLGEDEQDQICESLIYALDATKNEQEALP